MIKAILAFDQNSCRVILLLFCGLLIKLTSLLHFCEYFWNSDVSLFIDAVSINSSLVIVEVKGNNEAVAVNGCDVILVDTPVSVYRVKSIYHLVLQLTYNKSYLFTILQVFCQNVCNGLNQSMDRSIFFIGGMLPNRWYYKPSLRLDLMKHNLIIEQQSHLRVVLHVIQAIGSIYGSVAHVAIFLLQVCFHALKFNQNIIESLLIGPAHVNDVGFRVLL